MKKMSTRYSLMAIAGLTALVGCGKDGKDGEDGPGYKPPVVDSSQQTSLSLIAHGVEEGLLRFEFEIVDEQNRPITGLTIANAEMAVLTDKGVARSRDDFEGEAIGGAASASDPDASLQELDDGRYEFIAPMPAIDAGSEGIIRLSVGGGDSAIAASGYITLDKAEGLHTSTTAACHACHTDYAASSLRHASYTAVDLEGNTDLLGGCLVCHGNLTREEGGYARNTMQKIGHINHQKFEKDFAPSNCYSCHEQAITQVYSMQTCTDCHDAAGIGSNDLATQFSAFNEGEDARLFHKRVAERNQLRAEHSSTVSAPYMNQDQAYCTDIRLFNNEQQLDIEALLADGTLSYVGAYLHNYYNQGIVGRAARSYEVSYDTQGTATLCFASLDSDVGELMASSRVTFNLGEDASYDGVTLHGYSDMMSGAGYERRLSVTHDSCTTCHTNGTNYHKNGSYGDGGIGCIACHNNGQDRSARNSAPGYGPMVHSMHWGVGSSAVTGEPNSATKLNADNCVSCHAEGIDLYAVPNQFIRAKAFHGGDSSKMASPITANCFACHNSDSALNHMTQNGGTIDEEVTPNWFEQSTSESCATCHGQGKSMGIEKYHVFERIE